jgi:transposase
MFAFSTAKAWWFARARPTRGGDYCRRVGESANLSCIVFETGRMAPILFQGLNQLGLPVVCVESRQDYQALKSLATPKTDRNDARGLAHLARTGFFKPVHVKSLSAHAVRSQIRGLAVVFGVRLPRALTVAFIDNALKASEGIRRSLCRHAGIDCGTNRSDDDGRRDRDV